MLTKLHANATTTPRIRAYIQASSTGVAELAQEFGVSETTIRRWKGRATTSDGSHRPHHLQTRFDATEEEIAVELRTRLGLSLDDILEVMRRFLPRKTNLASLTNDEFNAIIALYNNTPRKCLDYRTPAEVFCQQLLHFKCDSTRQLSLA
jgi:IS30 family transposase